MDEKRTYQDGQEVKGARRSQGKSHFIERASCPNYEGCQAADISARQKKIRKRGR